MTTWTAVHQASLSLTNSWNLLELMPIESLISSNHLILCHPLLFLPSTFPSIRIFTKESVLPIRWTKYWSFNFSISPSNEYSGLISFILIGSPCCPRDSRESSPTPQFKRINSLVLSFLSGPTLTTIHDYWKNHTFSYVYICCKGTFLLFNTLSRFFIAFLPRSHLLKVRYIHEIEFILRKLYST